MLNLSEEKRQEYLQIAIGIGIGLIFFLLSFTVPYERVEFLSLDARFNLRPPIQQNPDIATIDIDDRALRDEGRWQDWTRDKHARVIDVIHSAGGAMVGVDIYFSEDSQQVVHLQDVLRASSLDEVVGSLRDYDAELAAAAKKAGSIYWGATFILNEGDGSERPSELAETNYSRLSHDVLEFLFRRGSCVVFDAKMTCSVPDAVAPQAFPIPCLVEASRGIGFAQIVREADGLVRKYPTFIQYRAPEDEEHVYLFPSMGLAMACEYLQVPLKNLRLHFNKHIEIPDAIMPDGSRRTLRIPINQRGEMIINWIGDFKDAFRHYPYSSLLQLQDRETLSRIKHFLSLQDTAIFDDPVLLMNATASAFPGVDSVPECIAAIYGARKYEEALESGTSEFSPALFQQVFAIAPEDAPALFEGQAEVFENVRGHYQMLHFLKSNPAISLEDAAKATQTNPGAVDSHYRRIQALLRAGGPQPSDRPLYFPEPVMLEGKEISLNELKGGVFFYGLTATGTHDLNPMPFNPRYPMVGAIANVFNTIVTAQFITPFASRWKLPIFVFIGFFTAYILSSRTTIRGSLFTMLFLVAYLLFAYWLFVNRRIWVDVVGPVGTILVSDAVIVWYKFNTAEKKRRFIKSAFEHYMNPAVVEQIAKNPDMLELGGKEMELTAFFSDVAGFTTISEQLNPPQLVELLNEYLTAMTDIVLKYNGLLDKYEGDAIIAVFGAPIHYSDHAAKACFVALDMQEKLKQMREGWKSEGKPQLHARVGINSGQMVVGNMGSKTRFDYTVIGDSVNLASRLEGVNKQYSTSIMISEFTYALCKSDVHVREIDLIQVKGKAKPVSIYEVLGRASESLPPGLEEVVNHYLIGLQAYRKKAWQEAIKAFEQALAAVPDDGPSLTYLNRCREYLSAPPPPDWDGVYVMTTK
ncbi:MAG: CHASE2 domain-containing protein [Candidatus Abyssobacteria bacterium SURF_5]|uniref:CHASE2 domain-containing protein n=1 Tax=Abyssobacteria bacterium (strain SURF_5) TaxID=2093360 RepID=A0A3A4P1D6_ABYX5|nr:MAG: CHASE2 domain-containing protein [Candidatus Abyssubacteria bacterium SURF_5]